MRKPSPIEPNSNPQRSDEVFNGAKIPDDEVERAALSCEETWGYSTMNCPWSLARA